MKLSPIGHVFFLISLTFIFWIGTLNQTLWGDGYYYFNPSTRIHFSNIISSNITRSYNLLARYLYEILIPTLRENFVNYQLFQLFTLSILSILIYLVSSNVFQSTVLGLITTTLFVSNTGTMYEMVAEGNFNRFLDRVPNLIISLMGVYFFTKLFKKNSYGYLIMGTILFSLGVFFGHFASFLVPFVVFLLVTSRKNVKFLLPVSILIILISLLIIGRSDQKSGSFKYLFDPKYHVFERTVYQVVPLVIPNEVIVFMAKHWPNGAIPYPYLKIIKLVSISLAFVGVIYALILYKTRSKFLGLYIACVLAVLATTAMMTVTDLIKYDPFKHFGPGRHLFIQSLPYSIILVIIISKFPKKVITLLVAVSIIYNLHSAYSQMKSTQYLYSGTKKYVSYIENLWPSFSSDTTIVVAPHLVATSTFLNTFNTPKVRFISTPEEIAEVITHKKKNIYFFDYDYEASDGLYLSSRGRVMDLTTQFQSGLLEPIPTGVKPGSYFGYK